MHKIDQTSQQDVTLAVKRKDNNLEVTVKGRGDVCLVVAEDRAHRPAQVGRTSCDRFVQRDGSRWIDKR